MLPMSRRLLLTAAGLAVPAIARAQGPRPIRFVVPFAAGGLTDVVARLVAQHMSQTLGQTVVVENRPGGNQIIATEAVARALMLPGNPSSIHQEGRAARAAAEFLTG